MLEVNRPDICFACHPGSMHDYGGPCHAHLRQNGHAIRDGEGEPNAVGTIISSASSSPISSSPPDFISDQKYTSTPSSKTAAMATSMDASSIHHDEEDSKLLFHGGGSCPCFCRDEPATSTLTHDGDDRIINDETATITTTTLISEEDGCPFSGFEGPEKKLEVIFSSRNCQEGNKGAGMTNSMGGGLRRVTAETWQSMLDQVHCKIMSITSNRSLDCYVLSESSLFVYPHKLVLKTCGTTTLLHCIPHMLEITTELGLEVEHVFFSRKNYVFPQKQLFPHTSFVDETTFLDQYFSGSGYILGSVKKDHWYLYVADHRNAKQPHIANNDTANEPDTYNLEIMMHDLDERTMDQFFKHDDFVSSSHVTESSGISDLLPGSTIDAFMFDPCGYSMNGLLDKSYSTIHITPEKQCSFVSYETNVSASYLRKHLNMSHADLVRRVLRTFKPGRATVALRTCCNAKPAVLPPFSSDDGGFVTANAKMYQFDGGVSLAFCNVFQESD